MILGLIAMGAILLLSNYVSYQNTNIIEKAWYRFEISRSDKSRELNTLYREIGYGGMIHNFKDYVLRGSVTAREESRVSIARAKVAIDRYRLLDLSKSEVAALYTVRLTLSNYESNLQFVDSMLAEGKSLAQIDRAVRVRDSPALIALSTLLQESEAIKASKDGHGRIKGALLNDLRRELGYGGMIHRFKNYIIRDNHDLIPLLRQNFENIRAILDEYRSHTLNDIERKALVNIEGVLAKYKEGLKKAQTLSSEGVAPIQIDKIVTVKDFPALIAFDNLSREINKDKNASFVSVTKALKTVKDALVTQMFLGVGLIAFLIVGFSWLIHSRIVRPVAKMTKAMNHLAEGKLDVSIPSQGQLNEIGDMGRALTVFRDAAFQQQQDRNDLVVSKEDADNANQAKSEFLSSMSHELRTPLNAILGFTQLMQYNPSAPLTPGQKDSTDQIIKGGNHLLELIDQVLELAKIEAGKMSVSMEAVSIREVFGESAAMVQTMAEKRNIDLSIDCADCAYIKVKADLTRFKQVLLNLLSNAVKYNNEGGSISMTASVKDNDTAHIAVTDTGPGIPKDQQAGIFQPFNRLGRETSEIEGTGIGLVITREIMHLMNGEIGFESEVGKGSTFWIDIPLAKQTTKLKPKTALTGDVIPELATTVGTDGASYTVLYVEDNPANLKLMEKIFERMPGVELISTHTAELGLEMAEARSPDLILLDINLPGMDGYEALERLKINEETSAIPVIAVTAQATKAEITRGRHAGFKNYITKPIQVPGLIKVIKETLESI